MGSDMEVLRFEEGETVEFTRPLLDLNGDLCGEFVVTLTWLGTEDLTTPKRIQMGMSQRYTMNIDLKYIGPERD